MSPSTLLEIPDDRPRTAGWSRKAFPTAAAGGLVAALAFSLFLGSAEAARANSPPAFPSTETGRRSIPESTGGTREASPRAVGAAVTATDPNDDVLTYSLEGFFSEPWSIDAASGQISTRMGNLYSREDRDVWEFTVRATDGNGGSATIAVSVELTDVVEPPPKLAAPTVARTGNRMTVSWVEVDDRGHPRPLTYEMEWKAATDADWTAGGDVTPPKPVWLCVENVCARQVKTFSKEVAGLTAGEIYWAQVRGTNSEGEGTWSDAGRQNVAPAFGAATASLSMPENQAAGEDVGVPLEAEDSDGDALTYGDLQGADAGSFELATTVATGGGKQAQLRTKSGVTYDFEARNRYTVVVPVTDGFGGSGSVEVTVNLTDVAEPPPAPAAPAVVAGAGTTDTLRVSWTAPATTGRPAIQHYDLQYRAASGAPRAGPRGVGGTAADIGGLEPDTVYNVQVRAVNDEGESTWSPAGTGRTAYAPFVAVAAVEPSVAEGGSVGFRVTADAAPTADLAVNLEVTATGEFGYGPNVGAQTVTIATSGTSADFFLATAGDGVDEADGSVTVSLQPGTGYRVGSPATARVTVADDDESGGGGGGATTPDGDDAGEPPSGDGPEGDAGPPRAAIVVDAECADGLCHARTGSPVRFEDGSSGSVRLRRWDFGEDAAESRSIVDHAWSTPGFYRVVLWTSDGNVESTASLTFLVEAAVPLGTCDADEETRCLLDSRFAVTVEWRDARGERGRARTVYEGTNGSALFWFFEPDNWELLLKVLDGCAVDGHMWVFAAATTDMGYSIRVEDTATGETKEYVSEPGSPAPAITDPTAFSGGCRS